MKYPLLTKWLADACRQHNDDLNYATEPDIADYAASLIEAGGDDIADVLEKALDGGCQFTFDDPVVHFRCGQGRYHLNHDHQAFEGAEHAPYPGCHPFQPLVNLDR